MLQTAGVPVVADGTAWSDKAQSAGQGRAGVGGLAVDLLPQEAGGANLPYTLDCEDGQVPPSSCLHGWDLAWAQKARAMLVTLN